MIAKLSTPAESSLTALVADDECTLSAPGSAGPAGCSFSTLQTRAGQQQALDQEEATTESETRCHTSLPGEFCYGQLIWAREVGMVQHPTWYPGLSPSSSLLEIQQLVHARNSAACPRPCMSPQRLWCAGAAPPRLWAPASGSAPVDIKILSYNLFWWSLFRQRGGNGQSAGKLIKANMVPPFDVMGFQECEDFNQVLTPDLAGHYRGITGEHAVCMAYNAKHWSLLSHGTGVVAEDMPTRYYGRRGAQWMRLEHSTTGLNLFFINHHGPLSVNSGGACGGEATANNLLQMMAKHAEEGDTIVLVGDFNANAGSTTIQSLWSHLVHAFVGTSFGGVDNIFSNVAARQIVATKVMGSGGSDHDAITASIRVGGAPKSVSEMTAVSETTAVSEMTSSAKPGYDWQSYWCGRIEANTAYTFAANTWSRMLNFAVQDPDRCCRACQADPNCASWIWKDHSPVTHGNECLMSGAPPTRRTAVDGVVSGLAYSVAAKAASAASVYALKHM